MRCRAFKGRKVKCEHSYYKRTPLNMAAVNENLEAVKRLIGVKGISPDVKDNEGFAPLHRAARHGWVDVVQALIRIGADKNVKDNKGFAPLHWAVRHGRVEVVQALIRIGADKNVQDREGLTPLHWAVRYIGIREDANEIVQALIRIGADKNVQDREGLTPLHWAVRYIGRRKGAKEIALALIKAKANVNVGNKNGCTPLHIVAQYGDCELIEALINAGADVNARDRNGCTPFLIGLQITEVRELLTTKLEEKNHRRQRVFREGWKNVDSNLRNLFHIAAQYGYSDAVMRLIIFKETDLRKAGDKNGDTPLHLAVQNEQAEVVRILLLHKNEDINIKNKKGKRPIDLAMEKGNSLIIGLFRNEGLSPPIPVTTLFLNF
ncbi:MAG: ankyrin repeat domain-containing protein [Holosporales bacterium]|nr:ankyrin repeat domain-containing protein [Holosporales bacterium]